MQGKTPLALAVAGNHAAKTAVLLQHGADVDPISDSVGHLPYAALHV